MTVNPAFDAWTLINLIKPGGAMTQMVYINLWTGWEWRQISNSAAALSDPYVLNLSNLGRPT